MHSWRMKQYTEPRKPETLFSLGLVETIPSPRLTGLPQRSLSSQSLGKYWELNQNNQKTEHVEKQSINTQKVALINSTREHTKNRHAKSKRDRREPGLVAFYNIRPENGAGLFLQARSRHGKADYCKFVKKLFTQMWLLTFKQISEQILLAVCDVLPTVLSWSPTRYDWTHSGTRPKLDPGSTWPTFSCNNTTFIVIYKSDNQSD